MIKRIAPIAIFTGAGQLLSIFALKYIGQHDPTGHLKAVGEADSLIQFIINLIAAGLQSSAMRNLALGGDWKEEYNRTQSARMALSLMLACLGGLFLVNKEYFLFMFSPMLAWSGDYALYALGFPVTGAIIAFIRVFVPYMLLMVAAYFRPDMMLAVYICSLTVSYLLTNLYISYFLRTAYFVLPRFKNLRLYLSSLPLGVVTISMYFIGLGLLLVIPYFYSDPTVTIAFVGLKFYAVYKGILRIIHQAFIKDMLKDSVRLQVDQLSILLGIIFAGSAFIYPEPFIDLFFGRRYTSEILFFRLLSLAAFSYSLFLSMATNAMLRKKDRQYTYITVGAALLTILSAILFSHVWPKPESLAASLCLGEWLWAAGLIKIIGTREEVRKRVYFILQNTVILLLPLCFRIFLGDTRLCYFWAFGVFSLILVFLHIGKFKTLTAA